MKKVLITGCAGFIGSHLTSYFLEHGNKVTGIDNLSRNGSKDNLKWLNNIYNQNFFFQNSDVRDYSKIKEIYSKSNGYDLVIHEAAQVAVTTSVTNPREDFEINALGTFNMLEATRQYSPDAVFLFASTNKVYGKMDDVKVTERNGRYEYETLLDGIDEKYSLDFHSPYGCSKGAADQYVRDYNRIYGLKTIVLRQSCIYGTRQFGIEDQGWIAWFVIASILKRPITIYGDGKQGRDILWIDDLVDVYVKLYENADKVAGEVFNVGGGSSNILSILELIEYLKDYGIMKEAPAFSHWRPGDQKIFVCNINKVKEAAHWTPTITPKAGIEKLIKWSLENKELLNAVIS